LCHLTDKLLPVSFTQTVALAHSVCPGSLRDAVHCFRDKREKGEGKEGVKGKREGREGKRKEREGEGGPPQEPVAPIWPPNSGTLELPLKVYVM